MSFKTFEGTIVSDPDVAAHRGQIFVVLAIKNFENDVKIFSCIMKSWATDTVDAAGLLFLPAGCKIKVKYVDSTLLEHDEIEGEIIKYERDSLIMKTA